MLTFEEAKQKLYEIAGDRYCSIQYSQNRSHNGNMEQECCMYIAGMQFFRGETWERVLMLVHGGDNVARVEQQPTVQIS